MTDRSSFSPLTRSFSRETHNSGHRSAKFLNLRRLAGLAALAILTMDSPGFAQAAAAQAAGRVAPDRLAPSEIVAAAAAYNWIDIAPADLLVMDLPPLNGKPRRVIIQLIPAPFSQGWVGNIRRLAAAHWWDGMAVTRVQDNYVAQWGDPNGETPKAKALPPGLATVPAADYVVPYLDFARISNAAVIARNAKLAPDQRTTSQTRVGFSNGPRPPQHDPYAPWTSARMGWSIAGDDTSIWPVHCYGMVGVGRNLSPDTGTGAELYTVIGHAPRHLDRNIALVGRVISGIENLSSLPRGTAALGVYATPAEHTPISSIRLGNEVKGLPRYQYLSTESTAFRAYAKARANRHDAFFNVPAGGADVCNIPVPVRKAP